MARLSFSKSRSDIMEGRWIMNNQDKIAEEMASLVLDVYRYAIQNNQDITSKVDIRKILTYIRPDEADGVNIEALIEGLVAFDRMTKAELAKRAKSN